MPRIPPEFDANPIWLLDQAKLIAILKDPASTTFQKAIACKRLAQIGGKESIAPLAALLSDSRLGHYGRFGLEPNPDPAVDEALRAALPKLKGRLQMGVIHSIGVRKDAKAVDALGKLMYDPDVEIAQAASASLGTIGGLQAARFLRDGLNRTKIPVFPVVARATLVCAEGLMKANRAQALELYTALSGPTMPKIVRLAAYRTLNAAASKSVG
ncbi:MAG: HEAT repeat domain-containing protein [Candidatus Solibacter sp.]|jgi:HEAT repeat protein